MKLETMQPLNLKGSNPSAMLSPAPRYVRTLEEFITKLDAEYDSLNEVNAKGANDKYGQKCFTQKCSIMFYDVLITVKGSIDMPNLITSPVGNLGGGKRPMRR